MKELIKLTQLIYSCWIISEDETQSDKSIPTGNVLGQAIESAVERGAFPNWAKEQLHFADSDGERVCIELLQIEQHAAEMKFTTQSGPSFNDTIVIVGKPIALRCLAKLDVSENEAKQWGNILRDGLSCLCKPPSGHEKEWRYIDPKSAVFQS